MVVLEPDQLALIVTEGVRDAVDVTDVDDDRDNDAVRDRVTLGVGDDVGETMTFVKLLTVGGEYLFVVEPSPSAPDCSHSQTHESHA